MKVSCLLPFMHSYEYDAVVVSPERTVPWYNTFIDKGKLRLYACWSSSGEGVSTKA